jgi:hypothetical protein
MLRCWMNDNRITSYARLLKTESNCTKHAL